MSEKFEKWRCMVCGYVYDEAQGAPQTGVQPGTRWADVPEVWVCPNCGSPKSYFEKID